MFAFNHRFRARKQKKVKVKLLSHVQLCDPRTVACQAPPTMGFSRQGYWSALPFPSPGDLPDPGVEPASPALASRFFTTERPGKPQKNTYIIILFLEKLWSLETMDIYVA